MPMAHGFKGRLFTVPLGTPFLPALVRALVGGDLPVSGGRPPDPIDLSDITVLLPTRRAARALGEACLHVTRRPAMLLPRIRAIGGPDEDRLLMGNASAVDVGSRTAEAIDLPPPIDELERHILLTRLVMHWSAAEHGGAAHPAEAGVRTPAQAAGMARELARLMDLVEREGRSLEGIENIVPDTFSEHWQKSLDFLKIITQFWPAVLADRGFLSPWDRQNRLLLAEAQRLREWPPEGPVVVAGVSGSIPATVELMRAVAGLEQGAIVLARLDLALDEESWKQIAPGHPEHPEFGLKGLLERLGATREDVSVLPGSEPPQYLAGRANFISQAMRPTETTASWHEWISTADKKAVGRAFEAVSLIETANPQEEADTIALLLREAAEHPDKTAALVTPDRLLARRVAIRLEAWAIQVDDSAGRPFAKTVPGAFLDIVIEAVATNFAPVATMALLKHPLARFGLTARDVRFAARALELAAFRTIYIGSGLDGIERAIEQAKVEIEDDERRDMAAQRLWETDWERVRDLLARLRHAFAPLAKAFDSGAVRSLTELAKLHLAAAETASRLTTEEIEAGVEVQLYRDEAGARASEFFSRLLSAEDASPAICPADYHDLYRSLVATLPPVIPRVPKHPRLSIWGPMESQLLSADVVILGGLNETSWPDVADPGPWLNRPMRAEMGLPAPEEELGREARDFVALLGTAEVFMTRAKKVDGVPTVPSRWLMRMSALLRGLGLEDALEPKKPWLSWARSRDLAVTEPAAVRPEPRPPVEVRPRRLSVSAIERWLANPYAIYADGILKLKPLPRLGAEPDAALKGKILHAAMSAFAKDHPVSLPEDVAGLLCKEAAEILEDYATHPRIAAFWLPRFARFAEWFAETEPARREGFLTTAAEVDGNTTFSAPAGDFTLTARADRLDLTKSGLIITDYKTGKPPSDNDVVSNRRPQLPLEAAIALAGGFPDVDGSAVAQLRYIHVSGAEPPGVERTVKADAGVADLAERALDGLKELVALYDLPKTPYAAVRRAGYSYDFDDYAHLARVLEWAQAADSDTSAEDGN